ncbi:hypothetical protein TIFTF001_050771 [Ficus carica]|uniref:Uncharacterized protein n=1 Tax=Ficus carica TaxID=3494 RepID=A0AA88CW45_FICCA|nr:hypothetical protein TIFTF001_050771 [Ficus carica]
MTTLYIAIVTTFFLPKEIAVLAVSCHIAGFHGWLFYLAFEVFRSRRGKPIDESGARALDYLEQQATSTRKRN